MKIENLRSEKNGSRSRIAASVTWEETDHQTLDLYFETDEEFAYGLSCNPHAFLVACIMPALRYGEERVLIDAEICPELRDGLTTAMGWFRHWYDWYEPDRKLVQIEAKIKYAAPARRTSDRAGFLFSGGIDSLTTLRTNRLNFPLDHPSSFKDALFVCGLEIEDPEILSKVMSSLSKVAEDANVSLIPVYTNIKEVAEYKKDLEYDKDFWSDFWQYEFMGPVLAAGAHAFSPHLNSVTIASHYDIPYIKPYGCHPLIDPNFSSSCLRLRHDRPLTRFEKTKLIADWDAALQNIRVCNIAELYKYFSETGSLNCGRCEKCVRTMLMLIALKKLKQTHAFPENDVSEGLARSAVKLTSYQHMYYPEMVTPLHQCGRPDLARIVESKILEYNQPQWKKMWKEWKQYLRRLPKVIYELDQKYLSRTIRKVKKSFYPSQTK
ncbi:MAG: hypothetical protein GQ544_05690 [Candidatus Aminicenantes bacterium]|nr:hypothetical protein [Candidatus Aminicenantes bacterium]